MGNLPPAKNDTKIILFCPSSGKNRIQDKEDHAGNKRHGKIVVDADIFPKTDGKKLEDGIRERGNKNEG